MHDAFVFRTSQIARYLETENPLGQTGVVLGDSGYPCRPFLMTPYLHPANQHQQRYNRAHKQTRVKIEHAFGVLKRRFHILHGEVRMQPDRVCKIITACAVLNNIAIDRNEREPPADRFPPIVMDDDIYDVPKDACA